MNYLREGTNEVLRSASTRDNQTFGTVITSADEVIRLTGYTFNRADKTTLTIGTGENVINLYYTRNSAVPGGSTPGGSIPGGSIPGTTIPDNPTPLNPGDTIADQDVPLAGAVGLNDTDHFAYIAGYEDNTVKPTKNITRAEVAAVFFRLMSEEYRVANWATENNFSDVNAGDWFNNAVSTCARAGILKGYEDGTFQPGEPITRAEFAAIAARFLGAGADDEGVSDFADTANKWYSADVRKAAKAGWIQGSGNRFEPDANITRAQVMTIVNRMLDRTPDADHMLPTMKKWIDNPEGTWYYEAVQEATNGHDYTRDEQNVETWTAIQEGKNWAAIEKQWAENNGASASQSEVQPGEDAVSDGEAA